MKKRAKPKVRRAVKRAPVLVRPVAPVCLSCASLLERMVGLEHRVHSFEIAVDALVARGNIDAAYARQWATRHEPIAIRRSARRHK